MAGTEERDTPELFSPTVPVTLPRESGPIAPQADRVVDGLDSVVEAHTYLESNAQVGKIVLRP